MDIKEIDAYQATDGKLFTNKEEAESYQIDLIGVALDILIPDTGGNITRIDRHKLLMAMIEDQNLANKTAALLLTLRSGEDQP